jgi:hypothetical protein
MVDLPDSPLQQRRVNLPPLLTWALGGIVVLVVAYAIPIFLMNDGVERWAGAPAEYRTAVNALRITHQGCEFTNFRPLLPRVRVVKVENAPGSCRDAAPEPDLANYVAHVRLHTLFGVPTGTLRATCGGNVIICSE